jgi:hypothetical protein
LAAGTFFAISLRARTRRPHVVVIDQGEYSCCPDARSAQYRANLFGLLDRPMDRRGRRRPEFYNTENNAQIVIGKENYFLSGDGFLMPTKKDQAPPDLRYFKPTQQ